MRRLLACATLAVAAFAAAPASAATCTGGNPDVCVTTVQCVHGSCEVLVVETHCTQGHPATLHCALLDGRRIDPLELIPDGIG